MNRDEDGSRGDGIEIEAVALSRPGGREHNEDAHGLWHDGRHVIALVADGAGGHGGGDVASATVRAAVLAGFARAPSLEEGALRRLLEAANRAVVARQAEGGALAAMRSTVVLAAIDLHQRALVLAHSGDSRGYLLRGGLIAARTRDHSLVQQMVDAGLLDDARARVHPQRHVLLSALGSATQAPEISVSEPMALTPGDMLLLCSDGLWEPLGDAALLAAQRAAPQPGPWLQTLERQVCERAKPDHDNYTALALWIQPSDDDVTVPMTLRTAPGRSPESSPEKTRERC
jgi:serine/threonine protein phosphatase PrpC